MNEQHDSSKCLACNFGEQGCPFISKTDSSTRLIMSEPEKNQCECVCHEWRKEGHCFDCTLSQESSKKCECHCHKIGKFDSGCEICIGNHAPKVQEDWEILWDIAHIHGYDIDSKESFKDIFSKSLQSAEERRNEREFNRGFVEASKIAVDKEKDAFLAGSRAMKEKVLKIAEGTKKEKPVLIAENIDARLLVSCYNEALDDFISSLNEIE